MGTYSCPIKFGTGELFHGKGKGIYLYEFDPDTAALELINVTEGVDNPSFLAIDKDAHRVYAVNELKEFKGKPSGAVSAFSVQNDGSLKFINQLETWGTDPCHVILSPDKKHLIVSNYMSGNVCVHTIQEDGSLGVMKQLIQYRGKSVNPLRQTCPHAHSAAFSNNSEYIYICDLGTDRVRAYRYGDSDHPLSDEGMTDFIAQEGAGPRLAKFGANGRNCYIINELESSISVTAFDKDTGMLMEIQKVSTLPENALSEHNICADLLVTKNGRFLYGSNRGLDNIAIYRIDVFSGLLSLVGFESSGGRTPRSFSFDSTGEFMLCANQDSDNIVVFTIDNKTGRLTRVSETYAPTPVCVTSVSKRRQ